MTLPEKHRYYEWALDRCEKIEETAEAVRHLAQKAEENEELDRSISYDGYPFPRISIEPDFSQGIWRTDEHFVIKRIDLTTEGAQEFAELLFREAQRLRQSYVDWKPPADLDALFLRQIGRTKVA